MKLSNLNEYLQTLATAGAIVGLLLVGYEVRQSNDLAVSQNASTIWANWLEKVNSHIDSDIARTLAKSMTRPDKLSLEEKMNLGFYYDGWIYAFAHDINSVFSLNIGDTEQTVAEMFAEVKSEAPKVFGSRFARAYLEKNRGWIPPYLMELIDAALEDAPIGSDLAYWQSIDELAATME